MEVLKQNADPIVAGETIDLKLYCRANSDVENMKLRFEIVASDNTVVGTMFSDFSLHGKRGENLTVNMQLDTNHLAPGAYRFDMLAFEMNDFGMQDWTDKVEGALNLEIIKQQTGIEWLPQWWGHVNLPDIHLISSEVIAAE